MERYVLQRKIPDLHTKSNTVSTWLKYCRYSSWTLTNQNLKNEINSAYCVYRFSRKFGRNGTGSGSYVGSVPRPPGPRGRRRSVLQCALKTRVCQPWFWRETKTRTRQITWHKTETWNYVISMETMTRRSVKLLIVKGAGMNCCDDGEMCEEIHVP